MELLTTYELIRLRDQMPLEELREITRKCKDKHGIVYDKLLYETMGYKHAFNDKWIKS